MTKKKLKTICPPFSTALKLASILLLSLALSPRAIAQTYEELGTHAMAAAQRDSLELTQHYTTQALKLDPANPHNALLFSNLGTLQRRKGLAQEALQSYNLALNITPRAVPILLNRATLYLELGKDDLARIDYSLVLDFEPTHPEALLMRAYIFLKKRDYKAARSDYERLLKSAPQSYHGRLGLATLEQKEGKLKEALALLNAMMIDKVDGQTPILAPQLALLYVARAGVEKELNLVELALIDLEEAITIDPTTPESYLLRGQIYLSLKKKALAKLDFEKALTLGIPQSEVRPLLLQCK